MLHAISLQVVFVLLEIRHKEPAQKLEVVHFAISISKISSNILLKKMIIQLLCLTNIVFLSFSLFLLCFYPRQSLLLAALIRLSVHVALLACTCTV